jgi:single-strand DNA-binding protein
MSSVNKVILVGHLGADPELRHTPQGRPVCNLSVATNFVFTDKDNVRQERVSWHRVVAWGKQGEVCKEHLSKGRQVYVEGRLECRSYNDKEGTRRFSTEIISDSVVFLGGRRNPGHDDGLQAPPPAFVAEEPGSPGFSGSDDVPF